MPKIILTLEVTEAERENLIKRFMETASAVVDNDDEGGIPSNPADGTRDALGVIWDARFHGANRTKNQDGSWRRKKGLSEQERADADAYEAGCKGAPAPEAAAAIGAPVTSMTPAPVASPEPAPVVPAFLQAGSFTPPGGIPGIPGIPAAPVPVAPPPVSYQELISAFEHTNTRVGPDVLNANIARIYAEAGVSVVHELEIDENKRRAVKTLLEAL